MRAKPRHRLRSLTLFSFLPWFSLSKRRVRLTIEICETPFFIERTGDLVTGARYRSLTIPRRFFRVRWCDSTDLCVIVSCRRLVLLKRSRREKRSRCHSLSMWNGWTLFRVELYFLKLQHNAGSGLRGIITVAHLFLTNESRLHIHVHVFARFLSFVTGWSMIADSYLFFLNILTRERF